MFHANTIDIKMLDDYYHAVTLTFHTHKMWEVYYKLLEKVEKEPTYLTGEGLPVHILRMTKQEENGRYYIALVLSPEETNVLYHMVSIITNPVNYASISTLVQNADKDIKIKRTDQNNVPEPPPQAEQPLTYKDHVNAYLEYISEDLSSDDLNPVLKEYVEEAERRAWVDTSYKYRSLLKDLFRDLKTPEKDILDIIEFIEDNLEEGFQIDDPAYKIIYGED